jgi:ElaA protein
MEIHVKTFGELSLEELYKILKLRAEAFVVEQECAYQDLDGKDQQALHVLGLTGANLHAYTRVFGPGDYFAEPSIGRVVVAQTARKFGYGKDIMRASVAAVRENYGTQPIVLSAQTYLVKFYRDLGFVEEGEEYLEDGIPHIRMVLY